MYFFSFFLLHFFYFSFGILWIQNLKSVKFDHFEKLLLSIQNNVACTLEDAFDLYFARDRLEDMSYACVLCKKKVSATTHFSLERAPDSLCIVLKRFDNFMRVKSTAFAFIKTIYRIKLHKNRFNTSTKYSGHYTAIDKTKIF